MATTAQENSKPSVDQQIQAKLAELSALVSQQKFGPDGPPKDLTFREIEALGHQAAQLVAAKFEAAVSDQHQQHFQGEQPCPQCGELCQVEGQVPRQLLTRLGPVELNEIKFHCDACRRSFFPAA